MQKHIQTHLVKRCQKMRVPYLSVNFVGVSPAASITESSGWTGTSPSPKSTIDKQNIQEDSVKRAMDLNTFNNGHYTLNALWITVERIHSITYVMAPVNKCLKILL